MSADKQPARAASSSRSTEERLAAVAIGDREPHNGPIYLAPYDSRWPSLFAALAARVRAALSERALLCEHVGSTSIEGMRAKPVIDLVLAVEDSEDEASYVPPLEEHGFRLRIREPDWFGHRLFKCNDFQANLHVFSIGCAEIDRMLLFRDWLRLDEDDRRLYERVKCELGAESWKDIQHYADAKSDIVRSILERALTAAGQPPAA